MTKQDLCLLLERIIDCEFTVSMLIGYEIMDLSRFTIIRKNSLNPGTFLGHEMNIDSNMKINDYRVIKSDGSIVDLIQYDIEYYFDPRKKIRDDRSKKINEIINET